MSCGKCHPQFFWKGSQQVSWSSWGQSAGHTQTIFFWGPERVAGGSDISFLSTDWGQRQRGVKFWSVMAHVSHELMSDEVIVMSSCTTAGEGQEEIFSIWDSHLFLLVCIIVQQDERNTVTGLSFITLHCSVLHHCSDSSSSCRGMSRKCSWCNKELKCFNTRNS